LGSVDHGGLQHHECVVVGLGLFKIGVRNMSVDIDALAPSARKRYLGIGRRYVTAAVLAQADKTMRGLVKYGPLLVDQGFGAEDGQDLGEVAAALRLQDNDTAQAQGMRKMTSQTSSDTIAKSKLGRRSARSVLRATMRVLGEQANETAAARVLAALKETKTLPGNAMLPKQLAMLLEVLSDPVVAGVAQGRGGPGAVTRLTSLQVALIAALGDRAEQSPTTSANERRDILDGMVVTLCRLAYTAAQLASRALGQPSIEVEFELTHLTPSRHSAPVDDAPADDAPAAPEAPTA
jgi:hypothetical protein